MIEGNGVGGGRRGKLPTIGDDADRLGKALQGGQHSILDRGHQGKCNPMNNTEH